MTDAASPAPSTPISPPTDPPPDVRCCPKCGYDLTGRDASGTCPECGREYTPETVLLMPLPGPFMLCVLYLWPFIGFAIATVFPFRSNDPY
ncbi:MAG: hypothetical protein KDA25_10735, partial [Phycisphaerales bacterium]|nr:hypothetical protein [Phycisphaerales bacterium]